MQMNANSGMQQASLSITIRRADGRVEKLGVVDYYDSDPIRLLLWRMGKPFRILWRKTWKLLRG